MIFGYIFSISFLAIMTGLFAFVLYVNLLHDKKHPVRTSVTILIALAAGLFLVLA